MRLGEIKKILDRVTDGSVIAVAHEPLYGDQAQRVGNYGDVIAALEVLSEQDWSELDKATLNSLLEKHPSTESAILTQEEFSQLNALVSAVNQKLPVFYSILKNMVDSQEEQTINIKLPAGIDSIAKLTKFNNNIENVLKRFNVDGQFDFKQFDKGSDWYVIVATSYLSYRFLLAGLATAQKYLEMRKASFESKTAELEYRAAVDKPEVEPKEVKAFVERKLKLFVENEVQEAIQQLGTGSNTEGELRVKLIQATTALIKELDDGAEFHLSLNPPAYAEENGGQLRIDYSKMRPLIEKKEEDSKQLNAPAEADSVEDQTE